MELDLVDAVAEPVVRAQPRRILVRQAPPLQRLAAEHVAEDAQLGIGPGRPLSRHGFDERPVPTVEVVALGRRLVRGAARSCRHGGIPSGRRVSACAGELVELHACLLVQRAAPRVWVRLVDRSLPRLELVSICRDCARLLQLRAQRVRGMRRRRRRRFGAPAQVPHERETADCPGNTDERPFHPRVRHAGRCYSSARSLPRPRAGSRSAPREAGPTRPKGDRGNVNEYEILLMLDADLPDQRQEEILARIRGLVEDGGGNWVRHDAWGRRRLAYEINKKTDGIYHLLEFDATPETLEELSRILKITDGVMRHMGVHRVQSNQGRTRPPAEPRESAVPAPAYTGANARSQEEG